MHFLNIFLSQEKLVIQKMHFVKIFPSRSFGSGAEHPAPESRNTKPILRGNTGDIRVRRRTSGGEARHSESWQYYFCPTNMEREKFGPGAEHPGPRLAILTRAKLFLYSTNTTFVFDQKFGSGAEHPAPRLAILSPSNTTTIFDQY